MSNNKFIAIDGEAKDWEEAIRLCGKALVEKGYVDQTFVDGCVEREKEYPTGLPSAIPVAIPHVQSDGIRENSICILRLKNPVIFYRMDSCDEYIKIEMVFNLAIKNTNEHLEYLQKLMGFVMDKEKLQTCAEISPEMISEFMEQYFL